MFPRTLLNKLEEVEASLGACGSSYDVAILKGQGKTSGRRVRRIEGWDRDIR